YCEIKKDFPVGVEPGWNSWDYYRWTITEDEVLSNAEFIKNDPVLSRYVKRMTVDDGWQYCYGEWNANPLFPSGMAKLAERLDGMGFEPGLWLAPTIFEPHSRIAQVKSEMLAMGESGYPCLGYSCMERKGFLLDPTCDDSREWLFDLFTRFVGYGYKFFKLDFLAQTLNAVRFHDESVGDGEVMRKILEPIREATAGKALLLGCNYTFEAGDDLVDSVRVSGDIHADWNCIKHNSPSIAARFWTQGVLWDNDPDFALARGPETSDDPGLHSLKPCLVSIKPDSPASSAERCLNSFDTASAVELETLLGLVIISGGCVNLSDNLPRLNELGLDLVRRTAAAERGEAGLPLDLFQAKYPGVWIQKISNGHRVLLVNWDDSRRTFSFDAGPNGVRDSVMRNFWTDDEVALENGVIDVSLALHASLLLETQTS
ncbi:MAG: alpha-galactosidase, partial [Victivallales bacterium]|nr:alpha-galactosidase [Victivallales bacterium]